MKNARRNSASALAIKSAELDRLRGFRVRGPHIKAVGELAKDIVGSLHTRTRGEHAVRSAIATSLHPRLSEQVVVVRMRGSTVELRAVHPTARFAADRLLRPGGTLAPAIKQAGAARIRWLS